MSSPARQAVSTEPTERIEEAEPGTDDQSTGRRRLTKTGVIAWVVLVAGAMVLLEIASRHAFSGNSDGATVILQGRAVLNGDLGLNHWALSLDSFWTVDVPFYVLGVAINGVGPALYHAMPAVIAGLLVGVGMVLARAGRTERLSYAGALTVFALLALPGLFLANFFVQGPLHMGTTLWCLLAFLGLRRGRFGWGWGVALLFLTAGLLGDFQTVVLGVGPVVAAGVVAGLRLRNARAALPALSAGLGSLVAAEVVRKIMDRLGTYTIGAANQTATRAQMIHNITNAFHWGAELMGLKATAGTPPWARDLHVLGALLVAVAVVVAVLSLLWGIISGSTGAIGGKDWRIDDFLVLALGADFVMFLYLTPINNFNYSRYLTAAVVLGSILGGRLVTRWATGGSRHAGARFHLGPVIAGLTVVVTALFGIGFAHSMRGPVVKAPSLALQRFLADHGLHRGIADYWDASSITVQSRNTIRIRPVVQDPNGRLGRYERQSSASWYQGVPFQFLLYNEAVPTGNVTLATAEATWGHPAHVYDVGTYRVLVWPKPLRVSP